MRSGIACLSCGFLSCFLLVACFGRAKSGWSERGEPGWYMDWERRGSTRAMLAFNVESGYFDGSIAFSCNLDRVRLEDFLAVSLYLPEDQLAQALDLGREASYSLKVRGGTRFVGRAQFSTDEAPTAAHIVDQKAVQGFFVELMRDDTTEFSITIKARESAIPFAELTYSIDNLPKLGLQQLVELCGYDELID